MYAVVSFAVCSTHSTCQDRTSASCLSRSWRQNSKGDPDAPVWAQTPPLVPSACDEPRRIQVEALACRSPRAHVLQRLAFHCGRRRGTLDVSVQHLRHGFHECTLAHGCRSHLLMTHSRLLEPLRVHGAVRIPRGTEHGSIARAHRIPLLKSCFNAWLMRPILAVPDACVVRCWYFQWLLVSRVARPHGLVLLRRVEQEILWRNGSGLLPRLLARRDGWRVARIHLG